MKSENQKIIYQYKSAGEFVGTHIGQCKAAEAIKSTEEEILEACKSGKLLKGFYFRFVPTRIFDSSKRNYTLKKKNDGK